MAFSRASEHNINAGVAGVLMPLNSIFVGVISFCLFNEKLQVSHMIGMLIVISGATLIALFPAKSDSPSALDAITSYDVLAVLFYGFLATCCLSGEIVLSKTLAKRGVNGKYIGLNLLLVAGLLGTLCLIVSTVSGNGFYEVGVNGTGILMLGGLTGVIAITLLQYSISIGYTGTVSSIFNTNGAIFTTMCYFFLDQALSMLKVVGLTVTIAGAVFLSFSDDDFKR